ncbi:transmembrane protein 53-like isoform X1 [Argiope bruennichi]|uniref:transmembrane protein 53-like isoform X1 n=2 Tax=Argiope bruennichi TaxID=94029 RepID=UPI0024948EF9|nr:transmembrane protein 53-like isoform X1 [Argiope bruennichi]
MSTFLRQFHIISSLKSNYDRDIIPFYKVIAPVLSRHPAVRKMHTQSINRNLQLKSVDEIENVSGKKKPLAVILAWMLAKESHIEKFRQLYISRGFDVLTVNMAPKDLLFPVSGSQVIAKNVLDYFTLHENYKDIVVHAFSVGGYLMGEMFVQMRKDAEKYKDITSRIRGVVLDSAVDFEGIPTGFPRAVTKNPITIKVLEWYVSTHLALMYNVATKHYLTSSKNFHNTPLRCPALVFVSEADKVGSPIANQMVIENWQARGVDVKLKCWKDSKHVSHLYKHQDEYISEVDKFLSKLNLLPSKL